MRIGRLSWSAPRAADTRSGPTTDGELGARLPSLGPRGEGWVAGQAVLIAAEGLLSLSALAALPPHDALGWAVMAAGAALLALGAVVVFRGISGLGSNLTALPAPVRGARLVETGVYRRVRHPIYAGVILMGIGWALFAGSLPSLITAMLLAGWFDLKSRREEVWLVAHHPGYAEYRQRTARFVTGIY